MVESWGISTSRYRVLRRESVLQVKQDGSEGMCEQSKVAWFESSKNHAGI